MTEDTPKKINMLVYRDFARQCFYERVQTERRRQDKIWGDQSEHSRLYWLGILMEEVRELSKTIIENNPRQAEIELTEVAAVCFAAFEFCFKDFSHK